MSSTAAIPEKTLSSAEGLERLRSSAGWMPLAETGWIAIHGGDRVRWLNGMVTNSVQALTPGEGAYTFLLNAQGRIQGDGYVWAEAERLLMETDSAQVEPMMALLDRFIIMDDVELADVSGERHGIAIAGPKAAELLAEAGIPARASRLLKRSMVEWRGHPLELIQAYGPEVPRFEIWTSGTEVFDAVREAISGLVAECSGESFELLRVLEERPRFGVDIRDRDLPQETVQTRALHFNKGCYLGQEIVERIRSRGQVHRGFGSFVLHGETPAAGTDLSAEGKVVGVLTTIAEETIDGKRLALGFVRRETVERGVLLEYPGGTAEARPQRGASNA